MSVIVEQAGPVTIVTLDRPERRNAVDLPTAQALRDAFDAFEADDEAQVAVLTGAGGHFCAGFDLKSLAAEGADYQPHGEGPMGPTRRHLSKPVMIGKVSPSGTFDVIWQSINPVRADAWSKYLPDSAKRTADWTFPWVCGGCIEPTYKKW